MQTANLVLHPSPDLSQLARAAQVRETFCAAYRQARAMIRDRASHGTGAAWDWYLRAARRRFTTPAGWRIAQLAGRVVFDARTPTHGTAGDVDVLLRQGLVRRARHPRRGNLLGVVPYRCATVDRVRAVGLTFAWSADPLASSANRGLRVYRAQRRREVARAMAADRRMLAAAPVEERFAITPAGIAALRAAEAASATA